MRTSKALQIGKAGEYLVCADLILKGFVAFPSEQGLPYDVLLDTGSNIIRIQVKTTEGVRSVPQREKDTYAYIFNIKRCGKNNSSRYGNDEIDLFALVCLDTKRIGYIVPKEMPDTINIRKDELRGTYYDEKGVKDYEEIKRLYSEGKTRSEISKEANINYSIVSRCLREGYKPYITKARYFSDIERDAEWLKKISTQKIR